MSSRLSPVVHRNSLHLATALLPERVLLQRLAVSSERRAKLVPWGQARYSQNAKKSEMREKITSIGPDWIGE